MVIYVKATKSSFVHELIPRGYLRANQITPIATPQSHLDATALLAAAPVNFAGPELCAVELLPVPYPVDGNAIVCVPDTITFVVPPTTICDAGTDDVVPPTTI